MFAPTKFDLISEISLVKFNAGNKDQQNTLMKDLLGFRSQTNNKNDNKLHQN
jgi:hypothetical protein